MSASIKASKGVKRSNLFVMLWTVPALLFYVAFAIIPLFVALYLSFTDWNGLSPAKWIGLQNWVSLLSDAVTGQSLLLTIEVMLLSWLVQTPASLMLGVFMAGAQRYRSVLSVLFFLPLLFSAVAIGITWQSLLDPNFGLLDILLKSLGLSGLALVWLGDPRLAFYVVLLIICWEFIPFHALLYLGGCASDPQRAV